eukprot:m.309324 g.309324  ORF g.309324 m.309324 type:complete len:547 (+) comp46075_c0_seq1:77-1717(+)
MCGIWALFGSEDDVQEQCVHCRQIAHRGPDAFRVESIPAFPNSCLGFHRLAIVDQVHGMQPMRLLAYPHLWLIYNGEIYNCSDVGRKYHFKYETHCDGEVILHLYARFGAEAMARMLDGVFAFCLIDTNDRQIHLGRDIFGVRPLFTFHHQGTLAVCSEAKGLIDLPHQQDVLIHPFQPGHLQSFEVAMDGRVSLTETKRFLSIGGSDFTEVAQIDHQTDTAANIRLLLKEAVKKRLMADRRIGCLLSGGLDSSLVAALLVECLREAQCKYKVQTFAIGMEGSPDIEAARIMANHLGTEHHEVSFTLQEGINAVQDVIQSLESFDITTIRASVGMYLVAAYIKKNTDTTVIFSGEGSDELCQGYIYFHKAPSAQEADAESRRLLRDLYLFDNLRADRTTAAHGLELRVPFLDKIFTSYYLSLPQEDRLPNNGVEKYLLRKAFSGSGLLPDQILWRPKEAFSDGVSSQTKSWFKALQESLQKEVSDEMLASAGSRFEGVMPKTKEAYYYRSVFEKMFKGCSHLTPYYWMPKWTDATDPSARVLSHYK